MEHQKALSDDAAERAVLGSVLLVPSLVDSVVGSGLGREDFRCPAHRILYDGICRVRDRGDSLDVVTLGGLLDERGDLERMGGYAFLSSLSSVAPSPAHVQQYVDRVREKSSARRAYALLSELQENLLGGKGGQEAIDAAVGRLSAIRAQELPAMRPASAVAQEAFEQLVERAKNPSAVTGLSTGFVDLDRLLGGLQPTDLLVLAARPGMGKTALALNLISHVAIHKKVPTVLFSLEMGELQLVQRLISSEAGIEGESLRSGSLTDEQWKSARSSARGISASPLFIVDKMGVNIAQAAAMCRSVKGLGLVVVDYLQLMTGDGRSREQEIASISRGLKGLAKELKVPVLALAQLNRGVEYRADKRPMMADLRESGAIEQDADVVMFLYRRSLLNEELAQAKAELLIRKHRNGSQGNIPLYWRSEFTRFESATYGEVVR